MNNTSPERVRKRAATEHPGGGYVFFRYISSGMNYICRFMDAISRMFGTHLTCIVHVVFSGLSPV